MIVYKPQSFGGCQTSKHIVESVLTTTNPYPMSKPMPRLFLIRHGETEWSLNGRHTGRTDIPLTARGESLIKSRADTIVGDGKLLDPKNICHIFISPRQRAQKTFKLLFGATGTIPTYETTDEVREWDYGNYEGLVTKDIQAQNPGWCIFRDGCPDGESPEDMRIRMDDVIAKVKDTHRRYLEGNGRRDVLIVAHGHFSRSLIARWMLAPLTTGRQINVEPAGITILSYNHHRLEEPAVDGLNLYAF